MSTHFSVSGSRTCSMYSIRFLRRLIYHLRSQLLFGERTPSPSKATLSTTLALLHAAGGRQPATQWWAAGRQE